MAISPINILRVTNNLQTGFVINSLQRTQRDLFLEQTRLSTGRKFVSASEDPISAARSLDLSHALAKQNRFLQNIYHGDNHLAASDSALTELSDLLTQASVIASQMVGDLTTPAEREAEAELIAAIRLQVETVGNRTFNGRYIFGGRRTTERPFADVSLGTAYLGDIGSLSTRVGDGQSAAITMPGNIVFGALSSAIARDVDLTPILTESTRLDDLSGATPDGVRRGTLVINEVGGAGVFTVDLSDADTIGDVVGAINDAASSAGASLTAELGESSINLTPGSSAVTIGDTGTGVVAASLGLLQQAQTTDPIEGGDLRPRVSRLTPVEALAGGEGIDLESGFVVTNGSRTVTIDLSTATTVQDIINLINNAGVYVSARVSEDGTGIDVFNQLSGASLSIGENGGTTAADLGIRTLDTAAPLDRLNFGRGVTITEEQDDFRITAKDGSTVDVNLDGAETIGDVIDLINAAADDAAVTVAASFAEVGNGIRITDGTGGTGEMSVSILNLSTAAIELGLVKTVPADEDELIGDDVNPTRTEGVLGALIDLENALRADDTRGISQAGARLDELRSEATRQHGVIGARSQAMTSKLSQMNDAALVTETFLSEVRDVDYAEAVSRMQASLTQLQANLQTGGNLLNLSLMDFLR